jgi:hypothetical protein
MSEKITYGMTVYARSLQADREDSGGPPMSDEESMARASLAMLPDSARDSAWDDAAATIDASQQGGF